MGYIVNCMLVLLIEDQFSLRRVLEPTLSDLGCHLVAVDSIVAALMQVRHTRFDLVILDLGSGDGRGLEVLEHVRQRDIDTELMVLSGRAEPTLAATALSLRVAEILITPYRLDELTATVQEVIERRQLRLAQVQRISARLRLAELSVNIDPDILTRLRDASAESGQHSIRLDPRRLRIHLIGRVVVLSHGDVQLLLCLARVPGAAVSPMQLGRELLPFHASPVEVRELMKSRVHRLRRKIEQDPQHPRILLSVRGVGYCLATDPVLVIES